MVCHITLLIRKLEIGGAERQVLALARNMPRDRYKMSILTFYPGGELWQEAVDAGIEISCLNKNGRWDLIGFLRRLIQALGNQNSDILHGFQGPPNLFALAAKVFRPKMKVAWGIRDSNVDLRQYDISRRLISTAAAKLSRYPDLIIANSYAGAKIASRNGYDQKKLEIVHNGIDTEKFSPGLATLKDILGLSPDTPLIGLAARFDPKKDHAGFLTAAGKLSQTNDQVQYVLIGGEGKTEYVQSLKVLADDLKISHKVHWAGKITDMAGAYNSLDILTVSSAFGEGFPNAIGEAMSCGIPCVATDTGDSALIVGEHGQIVPPGEPNATVAAWQEILNMPQDERALLSKKARDQINKYFSIETMTDASTAVYDEAMRR
jgi:glycosyltransferase involved in cell wall biosynthesis